MNWLHIDKFDKTISNKERDKPGFNIKFIIKLMFI